ncbi:hypothetical protein GCM10017687_31360 [Streptomyces echinatus]
MVCSAGQRCGQAQQGEVAAAVAEVLALGHVLVGADGGGHGAQVGNGDQADGVGVARADDMACGEHPFGREQYARAEGPARPASRCARSRPVSVTAPFRLAPPCASWL